MSTSVLQIRVDADLKAKAAVIYEKLGIDLPTAVRIFLKRSIMENGLPFEMTLPTEKKVPTERKKKMEEAITAIREMRAESERNGVSEMTLDEINAEIAAARAERHTKESGEHRE